MKNLIISIFRSQPEAEQVRRELLAKQRDGVIDFDDAVTVEKTILGKVRYYHSTKFTWAAAGVGAFLGAVVGLLLLNPVFIFGGLIIGFIVGLGYGFSVPLGINLEPLKDQELTLTPGQAALYVQPRQDTDQVAEAIRATTIRPPEQKLCTVEEKDVECRPWGVEPELSYR